MGILSQILGLILVAHAFAYDDLQRDLDPSIITELLEEIEELNGVEILRTRCPAVLGPVEEGALIEPVCLQLASFPDGELKMQNCIDAFRRVENKDALRWTLEYFVKNQGGIKDPSCFLDNPENDKLKVGSKAWKKAQKEKGLSWIRFGDTRARPEWDRMAKARGVDLKDLKQDIAKRGIENGCQIMMNDFSRSCDKDPNGPFGYWIDLCSKSGSAVRELDVVKKGTGTCANHFLDTPDIKTTVAGAFLSGEYSNHNPYRMDKGYKQLKNEGVLKKVVVFGMNESNNDSFWDKHVHTSPYITSSGCPALNAEDVDIIAEMGKSQTLIMNYGPEHFHQNVDDCRNGDGGKK